MLNIINYNGSSENIINELTLLFGKDNCKFDKNLIEIETTEQNFVELYKKPCILRYLGQPHLIAVSLNGKFNQR
tara:strand:+ start:915 stop:1136 length:222 start_codon:yes stop_codon:yes gene_type:complete